MPPDCARSPPTVAVVLAGGIDAESDDATDVWVLGIASRRRIERAVAWWQERPGRQLVVAGGPAWSDGIPESAWMIRHAQSLGVPASALRGEGRSTTTWENARNLAAMSPPLPRRVVLISSAMHLPRAQYAMEHAGFSVCTIGADVRRTSFGFPGYFIPQSSGLDKSEAALHEWVGLGYYRWLAWRSPVSAAMRTE
jgi:uncharacterized SAM-binding protein YcdF (DUF218 family)